MIKSSDEKGQSLVEFALTFPLFFLLILMIFDFAYLNYQMIYFNTALRNASWKVSEPNAEERAQYAYSRYHIPKWKARYLLEEALKEELGSHQDDSDFVVEYADIYVYGSRVSKRYYDPYYREYYRPMYASQYEISAKVSYRAKSLTPVGRFLYPEGLVIHKEIYKLRQGGSRGATY